MQKSTYDFIEINKNRELFAVFTWKSWLFFNCFN